VLESAWLFLGILGTFWQFLALSSMIYFNPQGEGSIVQFFTAVLAFICYGVFTYGSLSVRVVGDAVTYEFTMPSVTLVGVALTVSAGFLVLSEPLDAVNQYRGATQEDL
jgi:hypothetical protein